MNFIKVKERTLPNNIYGNHTIYVYDLSGVNDGVELHFEQHDSGTISFVSVKRNERLKDAGLKIYVECGETKDIFYPQYAEVGVTGNCIKASDIDKYIEDMQYAKQLCDMIMFIFNMDEHRKVYENGYAKEMKG